MAEYIEREVLLEIIAERNRCTCDGAMSCLQMKRMVENIPAADVAPVVHARWIPSESDFDDDDTLFDGEECCDWQCSACREDICYEDPMPMKLLPNCCPNCGAIMDGGAENESKEM